ncbi:MAG: hypothetical protein JW751_26440 [Polyangiaceae bacterium]|nr:hypothetical protein [Polyangiaceae bacterium]
MSPTNRQRRGLAPGSLAVAAAGLVRLFVSMTAAAEPPPRVVVVAGSPSDGVTIRIERELRALGVAVTVVPSGSLEDPSRGALETAARQLGAFAAIRIVETGSAAEVWVADRVTGKTVIRELVQGDPNDDGEVALGAVELLRASLLELQAIERAPRGEVAPTPAIEGLIPIPIPPQPAPGDAPATSSVPPPSKPSLDASAASVGLVGSVGFRGAGPLYGVAASLDGRLGRSAWGIETTLLAAVGHVERKDTSPSARLTLAWVGLGPTWSPGSGAIMPRFGLGLAAAHLDASGRADSPMVATTAQAWLAAPFLRGGVGLPLSPRIRARADSWLVVAIHQAEIRLAGERAATFGRPELFGAASLEAVVP